MPNIDSTAGTRRIAIANRKGREVAIHRFTVVVVDGPDEGQLATLDGPSLCAGSDERCELALGDPAVSRRHALFTMTPAGVRVEDLESTNGTFIGDVRVASAVLAEGGRVRIGATVLEVRPEEGQFICLPDPAAPLAGIVGSSQAMAEIVALVRQLARTDLPVLVTGETGTGKELIGRALHDAGPRRSRPFQVLDCGAIVTDLLRAELFGHERGAFTGADRASAGILEEASGGTVFFDEIGEIDLAVQPQLLRALETRAVTRIGSRRSRQVDFRVVAATNRDLKRAAADGSFRSDLYYRLSCVTIHVPPLRERRSDIPAIAAFFAGACAARNGMPPPRIEPAAFTVLSAHPWPGNVRELKNVVESCTVLPGDGVITASRVSRTLGTTGEVGSPDARPTASALEEAERALILRALQDTAWNRRAAARKLGVASTTLHDKVKRFGLKPPQR